MRQILFPALRVKAADDSHEWIRYVYGVGFAFEPEGGIDTRAG
ncbi:Uncharacterised protein [Delftia tsuruhatensis]|nr:hypothetical protein [Delftia tsuruhatensis]CAB5722448.1 Uncharacterised protein [Delftia tsuruhatensis]CAC9682453.1 Uncharacterised protein [Delftia tsuruhatensis]